MEQFYKIFKECSAICTDTRNIIKDSLFIALKGDNFDGNDYVQQAIDDGAKFVITSNKSKAGDRILYYEDTLLFVQKLANYHRKQFNIPVIGITGSNGKTTTKELIRDVLETKYNTHATKGNLNNHLGVPFTLLEMNEQHEIAVIEMGANKPNDIKELCEIAEPTCGIITNIGKAHLEGFIDFNGVYTTKKQLFDFVSNQNGDFFINNDYPEFEELKKYPNSFTYGTKNGALIGELVDQNPFVKYQWKYKELHFEVQTQIIGEYNFYNLLCATSIGLFFNVLPELINQALSSYVSDNNRSQIMDTDKNRLILDAYNANPSSVASALNSFAKMNHPNKYVILGDMLELGHESEAEHQSIVDLVKKHQFNAVFIGNEFGKIENITHFSTTREAQEHCHNIKNAIVLIKGSRGIKLESLTEFL